MTTIIGVRFKTNGKMYYFDPQDTEVTAGTGVSVETARGLEYGECVQGNTDIAEQSVVQPLKRMIRVATEADMKTLERNRKRADEAFLVCKRKIEDRKLEMNLVTAECTFDMNKLLFYFTADGRVDFRELVKDLAGVFRTRSELRQIGVRDEAKMIGGLGCCGRELCCSTYLDDFHPVSINMAKDQNLSLNPAKISGVGGQVDFVRGASASKGGVSIMAMPSTVKGKISKIVPLLDEGAAVTTSRNDVDYIVTEYGVAALKGQTLRQRARNLIELAHPAFRAELKAEYEKRFHCKY